MTFKLFGQLGHFLKEIFNSQKSKQRSRENLKRNLLEKDLSQDMAQSNEIARKTQSMIDSQGKADFSGSAYNGPGNVDREKINSNMAQRNFET